MDEEKQQDSELEKPGAPPEEPGSHDSVTRRRKGREGQKRGKEAGDKTCTTSSPSPANANSSRKPSPKLHGRALVLGTDDKWRLSPIGQGVKQSSKKVAQSLDTVESVLTCLAFAARSVLRDELDPKYANTIGYLCGVALRAQEIRGSSENAKAVLIKLRKQTGQAPEDPAKIAARGRHQLDETLLELRAKDPNDARQLLEAVEEQQRKAGRRHTPEDEAPA